MGLVAREGLYLLYFTTMTDDDDDDDDDYNDDDDDNGSDRAIVQCVLTCRSMSQTTKNTALPKIPPSGGVALNAAAAAAGSRLNSGRSSVSSAKQLYLSKARYVPGQMLLIFTFLSTSVASCILVYRSTAGSIHRSYSLASISYHLNFNCKFAQQVESTF